MKHFLGIDPGFSGAICLMNADGDVLQLFDVPTVSFETTKKTKAGNARKRTEYDEAALATYFRETRMVVNDLLGVLEATSPRPNESAMSAHSFGVGFGILRGMLAQSGIPYERIFPATWKAVVMAGMPKNKEASVPTAARLFPSVAHKLRGPRGAALDGRADALLLAEYGRRSRGGKVV